MLLYSSLKEARAFLVPGERGNFACEEAFSITDGLKLEKIKFVSVLDAPLIVEFRSLSRYFVKTLFFELHFLHLSVKVLP